jgi:hypothetical protein
MRRGRLGVLLAGAALAVVIAASQAGAGGGPGVERSAPTTLPPVLSAPTTVASTLPGETTTTVPGPVFTAPPRGGAAPGTTAKPAEEGWPFRRIGTIVGLIVAGLALLGFVYGRIRSTAPRPPLAPTAD